jgi:hypothetical protein
VPSAVPIRDADDVDAVVDPPEPDLGIPEPLEGGDVAHDPAVLIELGEQGDDRLHGTQPRGTVGVAHEREVDVHRLELEVVDAGRRGGRRRTGEEHTRDDDEGGGGGCRSGEEGPGKHGDTLGCGVRRVEGRVICPGVRNRARQ